jgi:hypothetical protein
MRTHTCTHTPAHTSTHTVTCILFWTGPLLTREGQLRRRCAARGGCGGGGRRRRPCCARRQGVGGRRRGRRRREGPGREREQRAYGAQDDLQPPPDQARHGPLDQVLDKQVASSPIQIPRRRRLGPPRPSSLVSLLVVQICVARAKPAALSNPPKRPPSAPHPHSRLHPEMGESLLPPSPLGLPPGLRLSAKVEALDRVLMRMAAGRHKASCARCGDRGRRGWRRVCGEAAVGHGCCHAFAALLASSCKPLAKLQASYIPPEQPIFSIVWHCSGCLHIKSTTATTTSLIHQTSQFRTPASRKQPAEPNSSKPNARPPPPPHAARCCCYAP